MNKRAAGQYLDDLFGQRQGYVAAAYKDRDQSWQEVQFSWPQDRTKLLGWAGVHADANVFICPALRRDAHTRKKGDMLPSQWLWADVDMQNVPQDKRADVQARIKELSSLVVRSGTGDNVHVYVKLAEPVDHPEHIRLNTGLRDFLYADAKQADNSLLRLPGTTNWKTNDGSPVSLVQGNGRTVTKASLMKRRVFRDVKVIDDWQATEWDFVETEGLPRRIKSLVEMEVAEAEARYGSRYKAVWAITGDLHRKGYDADTIHSLMHTFPPALSKAADENGYDVHRDVDKRLAWDRAKSTAVEETEADGDAGDIFEEISLEEMQTSLIGEGVEKELLRRAIRRAADQAEAIRGHTEPPPDTSESLNDALSMPPTPTQYLIQDVASDGSLVVIVGQYKTGKTKLMVCSLVTSLVDGEPFLGSYDVHVPEDGAIVGHWNLEMSRIDLVDKYMRPAGYQRPENVHIAHWQGYRVNLLTEPGKAMAVEWLTTRAVQVWTIDSWSALCRTCGIDPNDGAAVGQLLEVIQEIKVECGLRGVFMLAHIARHSAENERPGTKGASEVDAVVDTRWMLTVDRTETRFIQVEGRGTQVGAVSLDFDEETGRSKVGAISRSSAASDGWVQTIVSILQAMRGRGLNKGDLIRRMNEVNKVGQRAAAQHIEEAEVGGFIIIKEEPGRGRGGKTQMHYLNDGGPVEGDRTRRATPGVVNLANVRVRSSRD